jgi:hypothetical protein
MWWTYSWSKIWSTSLSLNFCVLSIVWKSYKSKVSLTHQNNSNLEHVFDTKHICGDLRIQKWDLVSRKQEWLVGLWCLTRLSTIFQLYRRKQECATPPKGASIIGTGSTRKWVTCDWRTLYSLHVKYNL